MRTVPHIHDIIARIVDDIRVTGIITASNEISIGVYTLDSDNELENKDFVTIEGIEYKIFEVTETSFNIEGSTGLDFNGKEWKANAPYYMHEKEPKANELLTQKTGKDKWQKYPLVLLLHPYTVDRSDYNYAEVNDLRIAIVNNTESEWNSDKRYNNNFDTILEPIYDELIQGIKEASEFTFETYNVPHDRTDALFLDGNPLSDKLDAILIEFDSLPMLYIDDCDESKDKEYLLTMSSDDESQGLTLPAIGSHVYNEGASVDIYPVAKEGFEFKNWLINGVENVSQYVTLLMDGNKAAKAFFEAALTGLQVIFGTSPNQINNKWYFSDRTGNNNNAQITNIQVGAFNGSSYIKFDDLTGITIVGFEGSAIPSISGNNILFSSGNSVSLTLSNGLKAYFNEGSQDEIYFTNGSTVWVATIENVVLSYFWGSKSEFGNPALEKLGYNPYLVCESAGTTGHLVDPNQKNLGTEESINGDFNDGSTGWSLSSGWAVIDGKLIATGTLSGGANQNNTYTIGKLYFVEIKVDSVNEAGLSVSIGSTSNRIPLIFDSGIHYGIIMADGDDLKINPQTSFDLEASIDYISVKAVQAISINSIFQLLIKPSNSNILFVDALSSANGYAVNITPTSLTLNRIDSGVITQLDTKAITINDYDKVTCDFISGINIKINDTVQLISSDNTYTTLKLIQFNNGVGDEVTHIFKDDVIYVPNHFIDDTGEYGVQNIIGLNDSIDCKGVDLLIPKNTFSQTGTKIKGILYDDWELEEKTFKEVFEQPNDLLLEKVQDDNKRFISELKIN